MRRSWVAVGVLAVLAVVAGVLDWRATAPRVLNQVTIQNTSGQPLARVVVRFGDREVEVRDLPAGATATLPAPFAGEGDVWAEVWYADGRTAHTDLGGPSVGRIYGWRWEFIVAPPGPAPGGITGKYAPGTTGDRRQPESWTDRTPGSRIEDDR